MTHADILVKPSENNKTAALGFGCMRLPSNDADVVNLVDTYLNAGFNYFDTAYIYGGSEEKLKKALTTRHPRDSYMIADKVPPWMIQNQRGCEKIFGEMLKRLGLDYIDFLFIHSLDEGNERNALNAEMYEWAAEQKKKGKTKHVGFSFHGTTELLKKLIHDHPEMEFVQLQYNYIDDLRGQSGQWMEAARQNDLPIIVMEPVKGGTLAKLPAPAEALLKAHAPEASIASWALRYTAMAKGATCVLSGMSDMAQMKDNIKTFSPAVALSEKEMDVLNNALVEMSKVSTIPCTACKYCLAECPQQIEIASCLNLYNEVKRGGAKWNLEQLYNAIPVDNRAGACTKCGICVARCPQHIDVPKEFAHVVEMFS